VEARSRKLRRGEVTLVRAVLAFAIPAGVVVALVLGDWFVAPGIWFATFFPFAIMPGHQRRQILGREG
jgi:hypothetical protein